MTEPQPPVRWVRALCDRDGDVTVLRQEVTVSLFPTGAIFTFRCPVCSQRIVTEASPHIVQVLQDAGVRVQRITLPDRPERDGPPITHDELLAFHEALGSVADPLGELTEGEPPPC